MCYCYSTALKVRFCVFFALGLLATHARGIVLLSAFCWWELERAVPGSWVLSAASAIARVVRTFGLRGAVHAACQMYCNWRFLILLNSQTREIRIHLAQFDSAADQEQVQLQPRKAQSPIIPHCSRVRCVCLWVQLANHKPASVGHRRPCFPLPVHY